MVAAWGVTTLTAVVLSAAAAAVVHVKQQRYDINDVNVEKHHHQHEVGAGTHAVLRAGEPLREARGPRRGQGRAPGASRVLGIRGFLSLIHFLLRETRWFDLSPAVKSI